MPPWLPGGWPELYRKPRIPPWLRAAVSWSLLGLGSLMFAVFAVIAGWAVDWPSCITATCIFALAGGLWAAHRWQEHRRREAVLRGPLEDLRRDLAEIDATRADLGDILGQRGGDDGTRDT